jgi:hypothetical protein
MWSSFFIDNFELRRGGKLMVMKCKLQVAENFNEFSTEIVLV